MAHTISITLTDKEYQDVIEKAKSKRLSVSQYVKRFPITDEEFDKCYQYLKKQALLQPVGQTFTIKSLFPDWEGISRGVRLSMGRNFYNLVKRGEPEVRTIKTAGKNRSNIQLYVRVIL